VSHLGGTLNDDIPITLVTSFCFDSVVARRGFKHSNYCYLLECMIYFVKISFPLLYIGFCDCTYVDLDIFPGSMTNLA
jgi:hypothetical protein